VRVPHNHIDPLGHRICIRGYAEERIGRCRHDVFKALALGAKAVAIGRPVLWGMAVGGAPGVKSVYAHLERLCTPGRGVALGDAAIGRRQDRRHQPQIRRLENLSRKAGCDHQTNLLTPVSANRSACIGAVNACGTRSN
jgi:hypothetical protein